MSVRGVVLRIENYGKRSPVLLLTDARRVDVGLLSLNVRSVTFPKKQHEGKRYDKLKGKKLHHQFFQQKETVCQTWEVALAKMGLQRKKQSYFQAIRINTIKIRMERSQEEMDMWAG